MKASEAPTIQNPAWNAYRNQIITAIADVKVLMQQRNIGINSEVLTEEVAELLEIEIDTPQAYEALLKLVRATRTIAQQGLRRTQAEQGGQYCLLLL